MNFDKLAPDQLTCKNRTRRINGTEGKRGGEGERERERERRLRERREKVA